jgi:hypothetical protein
MRLGYVSDYVIADRTICPDERNMVTDLRHHLNAPFWARLLGSYRGNASLPVLAYLVAMVGLCLCQASPPIINIAWSGSSTAGDDK